MNKRLSAIIVALVFVGMLFAQGIGITSVSRSVKPLLPQEQLHVQQSVDKAPSQPVKRRKIDFMADVVRPYYRGKDSLVYFVGNFAAHHNGAVISCDSAVRFNDTRWGFYDKVIINQDSIYIYGDSAIYDGAISLAEVYAPIVKVVDGDALLYTYNFTFNTETKIGRYTEGGVLVQDNDILESYFGYYFADTHDIVCVDQVEMHGSDYDLKSDSVIYNTDTKFAQFFSNTEIWNKDGDYLSADAGTYDHSLNIYNVTLDGYILTAEQEIWGDTLTYDRAHEHIIARRNIQMDDFENKVLAQGEYGEYWKFQGRAFLTDNPVAISYDTTQSDSVFVRADTMWLETRNREADKRMEIIKAREDSIRMVEEARRKAAEIAEARRKAQEESAARERAIAEEQERAKAEAEAKAKAEAAEAIKVELESESLSENVAIETPTDVAENVANDTSIAVDTAVEQSGLLTNESIAVQDAPEAKVDSISASVIVDTTSQPTIDLDPKEEVLADSASLAVDSISSSPGESVKDKKSKKKLSRKERKAKMQDVMDQKEAIQEAEAQAATDETQSNELSFEEDSIARAQDSVRVKLALDSIVNDSLYPDSILTPTQLRARMDKREADAKAAEELRKAEERRMFLDSIAKQRQAKMIAQYERERAYQLRQLQKDSIRRAKKRARRIAKGKDVSELDAVDSINAMIMEELRQEIVIDTASVDNIEEELDEIATDSIVVDSMPQDSIYRLIKAYRNVRIYRSDAQAVCDSMVGNSTDSVMRMYIEPVLWNNLNQIAAKQVDMYTKNQKLERVEFLDNPIMVAEIDTVYYNQVTGKKMIAYFKDNDIYRNDVDGNVQTIYFQMESEESKIVTDLIYLESASASFYLEKQELKGITYRNDVPFTIYPLALIPPSQPTKLPNFVWVPERRPDRQSIFDGVIRPSLRDNSRMRKRPTFRIVNRMDRDKERMIMRGVWMDREDQLKPEIVEWRNSRVR